MNTNESGEVTYEIKYTGYLSDADNVVLHYANENWNNVSEKKMKKLKSCCKTELTLAPQEELNFCFRDDNGRWDNNWEQNYFFKPGTNDKFYDFVEVNWKAPTTAKKVKTTTKTTSTPKKTTTKTVVTKSIGTTKKTTPKAKTTTKTKK